MSKVNLLILVLIACSLMLMGMGPNASGPDATITDLQGKTISVEGLTYDYAPFIAGKVGSGEVRVELNKINKIEVKNGTIFVQTYGETLDLGNANGNFSGKTGFGSYTISAKEVQMIVIKGSKK